MTEAAKQTSSATGSDPGLRPVTQKFHGLTPVRDESRDWSATGTRSAPEIPSATPRHSHHTTESSTWSHDASAAIGR